MTRAEMAILLSNLSWPISMLYSCILCRRDSIAGIVPRINRKIAVRIPAGVRILSFLGTNEFHNARNEDCNNFPPICIVSRPTLRPTQLFPFGKGTDR